MIATCHTYTLLPVVTPVINFTIKFCRMNSILLLPQEVLEIMINLKMSLPLRFVKDMLGNVDIDEGTR